MSIEAFDQLYCFVAGLFCGIALAVGVGIVLLERGRREILGQFEVQSDNVGLHRRPEQEGPKQAA